jgi:hypothetical protein
MTTLAEPIKTERKVIYLRYNDDADDNVMVHTEYHDPIFVTPAEAVKAIVERTSPWVEIVQEHMKALTKQTESMLKKLKNWCKEHSRLVRRADVRFLSLDEFLFVVMQKDVPYNFELSEKLTDLDIEISNDEYFNLLTLNVLAIPCCSSDAAQAFIDWEHNIVIVNFTPHA